MKEMTHEQMAKLNGGKFTWRCAIKAAVYGIVISAAAPTVAGAAVLYTAAWMDMFNSGCFDGGDW